jgi:hypothetical protein
MRKLVITMAICLVLALFIGAQTATSLNAPTMMSNGLFDMSKQKATLKNIENKLATGNTGNIAAEQQMMSQKAKMSADDIYGTTTSELNSRMNKTTAPIKAPTTGITKPTTNLQGTFKSLKNMELGTQTAKKAILEKL